MGKKGGEKDAIYCTGSGTRGKENGSADVS